MFFNTDSDNWTVRRASTTFAAAISREASACKVSVSEIIFFARRSRHAAVLIGQSLQQALGHWFETRITAFPFLQIDRAGSGFWKAIHCNVVRFPRCEQGRSCRGTLEPPYRFPSKFAPEPRTSRG